VKYVYEVHVSRTETYEVRVTEDHWREGCDYAGLAVENATQCCPVYRAMAEAGVPVAAVEESGWFQAEGGALLRDFPGDVRGAIGAFDDYRAGERPNLPGPLTFYVELEA
jgi:hypothetical protein